MFLFSTLCAEQVILILRRDNNLNKIRFYCTVFFITGLGLCMGLINFMPVTASNGILYCLLYYAWKEAHYSLQTSFKTFQFRCRHYYPKF